MQLLSHASSTAWPLHAEMALVQHAEAPRLEEAAEGIDNTQSAGAAADCESAVPGSSWCSWAMHIPRWMWRRVVVRMPVSSKLQLAGVTISLREYEKPYTERTSAAETQTSDQEMPAPKLSHALKQSSVSFQPHPIHTHQPQHQHQTHGHSNPQPDRKPLVTPVTRVKPVVKSDRVTATHTLLRQWGAEVMVIIQPPGWIKASAADPRPDPHVHAPGQPYQLQTKALNRLNSIWESQGSSSDDGTPTSSSGVRSLFPSQPNGHPGHAQAKPGSPGLLFTNRQTNPLCKCLANCQYADCFISGLISLTNYSCFVIT